MHCLVRTVCVRHRRATCQLIGLYRLRTFCRFSFSLHLPIACIRCCFFVWAGAWSDGAVAGSFLVGVTLGEDPVPAEMLNLHTSTCMMSGAKPETSGVGVGFSQGVMCWHEGLP